MANYKHSGVAATPLALALAAKAGLDISRAVPTGRHGEVRAADVERAAARLTRATPLAKRMAEGLGLDVSAFSGTGYMGKVTSADVLAGPSSAAPERERVEAAMLAIDDVIKKYKLSGMRKVIAKRMLQSHTEIPCVTQNIEVDVTALLAKRAEINAGRDKADKLSVNDFILRATAITAREQERYRMQFTDEGYILHSLVNIGMAVGMDEGLLVPVIRNADKKTVFEISREAKTLALKARENKLMPDELSGGVITVSNIGMYGTHSFTPIINQPEAAILGVNAAIDRLMLTDGVISVHKIMMLSLTYDHRIINGTEAAAFESRMKELIEAPESLID